MSGWRRSQLPKLTTTEHRDAKGNPVKTTIRRQEGPGDKTFLLAAASALKTLRQFAAEPNAAEPSGDARSVVNALLVDLLQIMTPEQANNLTHEQVLQFRAAIDARRKELHERRRQAEACRDLEDGPRGDPAGLHPVHQAGVPCELAPDPAGDVRPTGGEAVPPADDLQAVAAPQEQAGESPLLAAHDEQQSEPAGLPEGEEAALPPVVEQDVPADSPAAEEMQEQAETSDVGGPAHASSPDGAAPDERRSPVHVGGPRTAPTAAEHQAYQQWLAQQYAIAHHNLLLTQGLQLTPSGAPSAVNLTEGASDARRIAWTEAMSR